jgi:hypothetical protein
MGRRGTVGRWGQREEGEGTKGKGGGGGQRRIERWVQPEWEVGTEAVSKGGQRVGGAKRKRGGEDDGKGKEGERGDGNREKGGNDDLGLNIDKNFSGLDLL